MRGYAKVTLLKAYCISLPRDTALLTRIVLRECSLTSWFVLSAMDGKIKQRTIIIIIYIIIGEAALSP
jgi:hypothetical protein